MCYLKLKNHIRKSRLGHLTPQGFKDRYFKLCPGESLYEISQQFSLISHQFVQIITNLQMINSGQSAEAGQPDIFQFRKNTFKINDKSVQLVDENPFWNQFIFNYPLKDNGSEFTIHIERSKNTLIMFGVLDCDKRMNELYSHDTDFDMACYYGKNTKVFPAGGYQGGGFRQGDIVTVKVDRQKGEIVWFVNGQKQACLAHRIAEEADINLMPFVEMNETYDIVRWCIAEK